MNRNTILPVRCISCGKILATLRLQNQYDYLLDQGFSPEEALDQLGINKYCCRTRILSPQVLPLGSYINDESNIPVRRNNDNSQPHSIILPRRTDLLRIPRTPNPISVTQENGKTYTLYYAV